MFKDDINTAKVVQKDVHTSAGRRVFASREVHLVS